MSYYRIKIKVSDIDGIYNADNIEKANEIAQSVCDNVYHQLRGKCSVEVDSVEEVID